MATLLVYMTSHGCTEKAAGLIRGFLPSKVDVVNLDSDEPPALDLYDTVVIGGSIRIGRIQKRLRRYCEKNQEVLLQKRYGLYICCMYEGEKATEQLRKNYPEPLVNHAAALGLFGGELDFDTMTSFEQMIIRDIIGIRVNVSIFKEEAVKEFVAPLS